ncbi:MAG: DUF488 family protein [Thaumarchaeota archaeon]|nr:DUF488 family protein [Nitrososphaerota archaeon]
MIKIKRIHEEYLLENGFRILIDRLRPSRILKSGAKVDLWLKDIAHTDHLRKRFSHDPKKCEALRKNIVFN